jgi:acyl transferase domain-containing protein
MNESEPTANASSEDRRRLLEQALQQVRSMRARLDAAERAASEPIAVVGMSCRFPGGSTSVDAYWRLLRAGIDAIGPMPQTRWNQDDFLGLPSESVADVGTAFAGALEDIETFDAEFFGLRPDEAARLDPQHRLVLEVAWEAIEHAGLTLDVLRTVQTGVFLGVYNSDYLILQLARHAGVDAFTASGAAHSLVANRISYLFDFHGPSLAIDTACSSSLVAVHLACGSLRAHESDVALAGGVNLITSPVSTVLTSRVLPMAADGRCKAFDGRADGIVRSEGCGVVVLKRLSDALAARDAIIAVVRGSAVNHDGLTNGLTAPSSPSQQLVLAQALKNARVDPSKVSLIETHGTGTPLGDAIELEALQAIYNTNGHERQPCAVGSVKTNLGHLEAAAGIAGFMKVALALQRAEIPAHLHVRRPHPLLSDSRSRFFVPTASQPWPSVGQPRFGCVSSFGFGGTNAHVVLQEAPVQADSDADDAFGVPLPLVMPVSARSHAALADAVALTSSFLASTDRSPADICYAAAARRTHHRCRCAVIGTSREELIRALGERSASFHDGTARQSGGDYSSKLAFVFSPTARSGQSALRAMLDREPLAAGRLQACDTALTRVAARTDALVDRVASFAAQIAAADWLRSIGAAPATVVGLGAGAVAAAWFSNALDLDHAIEGLAEHDDSTRTDDREPVAALTRSDYILIGIGDDVGDERVALSLGRCGLSAIVAALYELGVAVDWRKLYSKPRRAVALPSYPWQRRRHWIQPPSRRADADTLASLPSPAPGPSINVTHVMEYITQHLIDALRSLGSSVVSIDPDMPLRDLDLDSITVVELKNQAERDLHLTVPLLLLLDGSSIRTIASTLAPADAAPAPVGRGGIAPHEASGLLQRFDSLSDRDVEEMLGRLLNQDGAAETA